MTFVEAVTEWDMTWNTVMSVMRSVTQTPANQRQRNCLDDQSEDNRSHQTEPIIRPEAWQLSHYCDDILCHDTFWFSVFLGIVTVVSWLSPQSSHCHDSGPGNISWRLRYWHFLALSGAQGGRIFSLSVCLSIHLFGPKTCLELKIFILGLSDLSLFHR